MQHLNLEALARLVDDLPAAEEADHLRECGRCRAELQGLREQSAALATLPRLEPPRGLEARVSAAVASRSAARWGALAPVRAAAAVALFLAGGLVGSGITRPPAAGGIATVNENGGIEAAATAVAVAEAEYLRALSRYVELSDEPYGLDPINRLAALEGIVLTTRAALREAPADPVINNYHLTALGHRDALLRQIGRPANDDDDWF